MADKNDETKSEGSGEDAMNEEDIAKAKAERSEKSNRAQLAELLERMTPEDIFNMYDKDGSGGIDYEEFVEMLPQIGVKMGEAKALKFYRMCDRDGSGEIDVEEFKMALYAFDGESSNSNGYKPNDILSPHDAFEMFDEDGSGELGEDELAFALEYLNLDVSGSKQELFMNKFDTDGSGALEYPEFRKMWLFCCNPFAELRQRGIKFGRFLRKPQARVILEAAVIHEEEQELRAMAEANAAHNFLLEKKRRMNAIQRAFERAQDELAACLDLAGQVYMFGHGVTHQFNHGPALQEHSYIAPVARYRGENEFRRYPYDLMGQPVSVKGENDISNGDHTSEDPDDETALEGSKRFGYLHEERELSRVVNMWTRRSTGIAKRPRSVRQLEELLAEEASDPIPELEKLYGEDYVIGRGKAVFNVIQKVAEMEAAEAAAAAAGYVYESDTDSDLKDSDDSDDSEEEEHLQSLTIGGGDGGDGGDDNEEEEGDGNEEGDDQDDTKSQGSKKSKGSKYSQRTHASMTSWDIERRARKKRYARAKEFRLKKLKEKNDDAASVTSTVVSGWGDIKAKVKRDGSVFADAGEINPFSLIKCCHSTAPLWGRRVMSVSIGHNLAYAVTDMGEIIGWGGQNKLFDTTADEVRQGLTTSVGSEERQKQALSHLTPRSALLKGFGLHNTSNGVPVGSDKNRRERRQRNRMPRAGETPSDGAIAKIRAIRSRGSSAASSNQSTVHLGQVRPGTTDTQGTSGTAGTTGTTMTSNGTMGDSSLMYSHEEGGPEWINTVEDYQGPGLMKPLFPSWIGIGDHPDEEASEIKICINVHDYKERDSAILKRVFRYFEVFEPPPSHGTQLQFLRNVLMPKVDIQRVRHALCVRLHGFGIKGKAKEELIRILSKCLRYERRYLPIRTIVRMLQIERELKEILESTKIIKSKRSKLMTLWVEAFTTWAPLKLHINEEAMRKKNKHAEMLLNQQDRAESEYNVWREKTKQSRDDCEPLRTVRGSGLAIDIGSATFRGPEERTPRGGTGAQSIAAGGAHSAIVLSNGELYTWGAGTFGRLGLSEYPKNQWTGIKRKNPATIHRMKEAVREVESQEELDALLASPAYSAPPPTVVPRTKRAPTHEEMALKELELKAEAQRQRMLGNDPFSAAETSGRNATTVPPLMIIPRPPSGTSRGSRGGSSGAAAAGGGGGTARSRRSGGGVGSLLDTFEEGENEEYNKAGAWEKEYRQGDRMDRSRPTLVRSLRPHPLRSVSCGWNHTVALTVLGEVLVWGDASHGKLGIGKTTWESEGYECYCPVPWPLRFGQNLKIRQLSCGNAHTCFITTEGKLYVCGSNDGGKLGLGRERLGTTVSVPEQVKLFIVAPSF
jgi:Ca2+-binding EF-hand superfamily protein